MPERNLDLPRSPPEMSTAFLPSALRLRYLARYLLSLVLHPLAAVIPRAVRAAGILRVDQAVVIPRVVEQRSLRGRPKHWPCFRRRRTSRLRYAR